MINGRPSVMVVDDHDLIRHALVSALTARGITAWACPGTSKDQVVEALADKPDLVVVDLDLGGEGHTGADLVPLAREAGARVAVLTAAACTYPAAVAVCEGAESLLAKSDPFAELVDTIARLARGGATAVDPVAIEALRNWAGAVCDEHDDLVARMASLTPREREMLDGLSDGARADELAAATGLSVATVRTHIRAVLAKLGVGWQLAAVSLARRANPWRQVDRRPPGH